MNGEKEIIIFQADSGAIELKEDLQSETIWGSIDQIANLFGVQKAAISKHLKNIYKDQELEKEATVSKMETVRLEGNREVSRNIEYYNLDAIISVGYRVNSKTATKFRRWATQTLKTHITKGYTINPARIEQNYEEFLKAVEQIKELSVGKANVRTEDVLELVKTFSQTWFSLESYDKEKFPKKGNTRKDVEIQASELYEAVAEFKNELQRKKEATDLFAQEKKAKTLEGILGNVFQSVFGEDAYPSLEEKAAHLLYFIIKNHPFNDGNKRTGAFAFVWFLQRTEIDFQRKISPETLTALALLIAESDPKEKDKMIGLVLLILN